VLDELRIGTKLVERLLNVQDGLRQIIVRIGGDWHRRDSVEMDRGIELHESLENHGCAELLVDNTCIEDVVGYEFPGSRLGWTVNGGSAVEIWRIDPSGVITVAVEAFQPE